MGDKKAAARAFAATLRELRLERRLTQDELAERARTERSHISALERAEKAPALSTIFALADALELSPGDLVDRARIRLTKKR